MVYFPTICNCSIDSYGWFMGLYSKYWSSTYRMVFNASYNAYTNCMGIDSDSEFIGGFYDYMEFSVNLGSDGCIWI
jgi:hypothetical protein